MQIILTIDVPEYHWVDTPTLYSTMLGDFGDEMHVRAIQSLIEYLQRLKDIDWIINANHQHVRHPFCRELVRDRLKFIPELHIWHIGEQLSYFLQQFNEGSGLDFAEYKFQAKVLSNGRKIQFKTFNMLFDNEADALRHIAKIHTSKSDFSYTVEH